MQVEWSSYNSPIGTLTVVECEAGPLAVEFPHRAMTIKWAVRLRAAVPELHIAQGTCRITTTWLDEYFAGSSRPLLCHPHRDEDYADCVSQIGLPHAIWRLACVRRA